MYLTEFYVTRVQIKCNSTTKKGERITFKIVCDVEDNVEVESVLIPLMSQRQCIQVAFPPSLLWLPLATGRCTKPSSFTRTHGNTFPSP